jgi:hypothetical protein
LKYPFIIKVKKDQTRGLSKIYLRFLRIKSMWGVEIAFLAEYLVFSFKIGTFSGKFFLRFFQKLLKRPGTQGTAHIYPERAFFSKFLQGTPGNVEGEIALLQKRKLPRKFAFGRENVRAS